MTLANRKRNKKKFLKIIYFKIILKNDPGACPMLTATLKREFYIEM